MTFEAFSFNHEKTQAPLQGDISISYEFDEEEKVVNFRHGDSDGSLKKLLVETWPSLGALNLHTSRHGDCQTGYYYDIKSRKRGNMGALKWDFTMEENDSEPTLVQHKIDTMKKYDNTYSEAGFYQKLIPGSMLGVPKDQPEVVVTVNRQRSGKGFYCKKKKFLKKLIILCETKLSNPFLFANDSRNNLQKFYSLFPYTRL